MVVIYLFFDLSIHDCCIGDEDHNKDSNPLTYLLLFPLRALFGFLKNSFYHSSYIYVVYI